MRRFADLIGALDASTPPDATVAALRRLFVAAANATDAASAADAAWAVYFLAGGKLRPVLPKALLRALACQQAGIDGWLFDACHRMAGDLAETIAHVVPAAPAGTPVPDFGLAQCIEQGLLPLRGLPPAEQAQRIGQALVPLDTDCRCLLIRLVGGLRLSPNLRPLLQRVLAELAGVSPAHMAQRLQGWADARLSPSAARWQALVAPVDDPGLAGAERPAPGLPYPFCMAQALLDAPQTLGPCEHWQVEWQYEGQRVQLVKRAGQVGLWLPGDRLVTAQFPEVATAAATWPDGSVLDGVLVAWQPGSAGPAPVQALQVRLKRQRPGKKLLADAPVRLLAFDLLAHAGRDLRQLPLEQRRAALEASYADWAAAQTGPDATRVLSLSTLLQADTWADCAALRQAARQQGMQGLVFKQVSACYGAAHGQTSGPWWAWQQDGLRMAALLVYAQPGPGRRDGVCNEYTLALWNRPPADAAQVQAVLDAITRREAALPGALQLVPVARLGAGLCEEDLMAVDQVVRATTVQKFGPVRSLRPSLVFEVCFEALETSPRHKSGVALRQARVLRLCKDQPVHAADALPQLQALMRPA